MTRQRSSARAQRSRNAQPEGSRASIKSNMESMRNALKALDGAGGQVSKDQLDSLGQTCQRQLDQIRKVYERTAPECLK